MDVSVKMVLFVSKFPPAVPVKTTETVLGVAPAGFVVLAPEDGAQASTLRKRTAYTTARLLSR